MNVAAAEHEEQNPASNNYRLTSQGDHRRGLASTTFPAVIAFSSHSGLRLDCSYIEEQEAASSREKYVFSCTAVDIALVVKRDGARRGVPATTCTASFIQYAEMPEI